MILILLVDPPPACADPSETGNAPDRSTAGAESASRIVLSADTPDSSIATFALGVQVKLSFNVTGMQPRRSDLELRLHFVDEIDRTVKKQSLKVKADADGNWTKEIAAPCEKMGFWRVFVELSNGVTLSEEGVSRRSGYITYVALTFLLEGHKSSDLIEGLGEKA